MEHGLSLSLGNPDLSRKASQQAGPVNTSIPTISGLPEVGQTLSCTTGTWNGNGIVSHNYQWLRNGVNISGAITTSYLLIGADDQTGVSCRITAIDEDGSSSKVSSSVGIYYAAPSFASQPSITPSVATVGATFTLFEGAASPGATITIDYFDLDGVDKIAELAGLSWDSTGETTGTLRFRAIATNSGGSVQSAEVSAVLEAVITAPGQFQINDWNLSNTAAGGTLAVTITTLPADGGSPISDIEYQVDGGVWISSGLSAVGIFTISSLNDDQQYSVSLRAVNSVGVGAASLAKMATPTATLIEIARFGTWNGTANAAPYDTSGAAADGVFGEFSVTGGIITPNTQNLTAGTYSVGGYPVEVNANIKAVSSQTEFNNAVVNVGDLDGINMVVRWNSEITGTSNWTHRAIWRTVANCVIEGDGNPKWEKSEFHFGHVIFDNCSNVTWRNLAFRSFTIKSDHNYGPVKRAVWEDNHFGDADPDTNADYSSVGYSGNNCFSVANSGVHGMRVVNNTFRGGGNYAHILFYYEEWGELVGNHFDKYYTDAIKIRGSDPIVVSANICTRPFSLSSDTGNPHSDSVQIENTLGQSTDVIEANFFVRGNCRGTVSANLFISAGPGFDGAIDGNGSVTSGFYGNRVGPSSGVNFDFNGALPIPGFSGTVSNTCRNSIDSDLGGGTTMNNSFGGNISVPGSVSVSGNVALDSWDQFILAAALPNWNSMTMDRPSYADALNAFTPAVGGALDGKGPGAVVTLAPGAMASEFQMASLRPTPVLSGLSITPSMTSFSATVVSNVAKRPVFWAVVPAGTSVADWREIKERSIANGLNYGFASSTSGGVIAIAGTATTLVSSTGYELVLVQENGWTTRSSISTGAFTTTDT